MGCGGEGPRVPGCLEQPGFLCAFAGSGKGGVGAEHEPALQTELFSPQGVWVGPDGHLYLVDWNNQRIRAVDPEGLIRTVAGTTRIGDGVDGPALEVELYQPTAVAFDAQGRLLIAAWRNHKVMRLEDGKLVTIVGTGKRGFGGDGGPATSAQLDLPVSLAVDAHGGLYVTDQGNRRVRYVDAGGTITTVVGTGEGGFLGDGGPATQATFDAPTGQAALPSNKIALGPDGALYLADSGNHRVRRVDADGIINTVAGTGEAGHSGDGGPATQAQLNRPTDLSVAQDGTVYVADTDSSCIRRIAPDGNIHTAAGKCGVNGNDGDNGPAVEARLHRPFGVHVDGAGRVFVSDTLNHRVRVVVP